jgi:hypothetical protein
MAFLSFQSEIRFQELPRAAVPFLFKSSRGYVHSNPSSFSALLPGSAWRTARRSFQNLPRLRQIAHGKDDQLFLRACF